MSRQRLGLTDLTLCEILQRLRDDAAFLQVRQDLSRFQIFTTGGVDLAAAAAQNYRWLRRKGHTIRKTIDCLIATFCREEGHWLLHRDRDFDPFEKHLGLRVVHSS
jgi:predicted nucleic acid-binding protein